MIPTYLPQHECRNVDPVCMFQMRASRSTSTLDTRMCVCTYMYQYSSTYLLYNQTTYRHMYIYMYCTYNRYLPTYLPTEGGIPRELSAVCGGGRISLGACMFYSSTNKYAIHSVLGRGSFSLYSYDR